MKKAILVVAAVGLTYVGIAQDKYVTSALTNLNSKNLEEAKSDIDRAIAYPETKEKPKALLAKGRIYMAMQNVEKYQASAPYREAAQALIKLAEIKPEYEKEEINRYLSYSAKMFYNDGIKAYEAKNYTESVSLLKNTIRIQRLGEGKRFGTSLDTVAINAETQIARCAYALNDYEEVIRQINVLKQTPAGKTNDNYIILLESYEKYNNANGNKMQAEELAATTEARLAFQNDPNIKNMEMNTLMKYNKTNDLMKKMEDEIVKSPDDADLNYNLGILYQTLATPAAKDKKPANSADLMAKAEGAMSRAVKLAPENPSYNNALGTIYYNQGYEVNEQMNLITGYSEADTKKINALKAKRDALFNKALVPYEKAASIYAGRTTKVEGNDLDIYHSTLVGMKQIYIVLDKGDKIKEVAAKLKEMEGK